MLSTGKPNKGAQSVSKPKSSAYTTRAFSPTGNQGFNSPLEGEDVSMKVKLQMLEKDLDRRQESYVERERAYKARIEDLEEEINNQKASKTGWMKSDSKFQKIKNIHSKILDNIELVQDRTARVLQNQERDLLRAFRGRLFDVQNELEKEKSKKDDGAGAWIEKCRQLESEVEWAKEVADRLERVNHALLQDNGRLKAQYSSQEEDRVFLIQQLVAVKKDNERLRLEYAAVDSENKTLKEERGKELEHTHHSVPLHGNLGGMGGHNAQSTVKQDGEERYKEVNVRLKRLLAEERKALAVTRQNYANELRSRTEMEMILRQCVEDVRKEISKRRIESNIVKPSDFNKLYQSGGAPPVTIEDFQIEDRERILELLLSQERVVTLLYAKTFPVTNHNQTGNLTTGTHPQGAFKNPALNSILAAVNEEDADKDGGGGEKDEKFLPQITR